MVTIGGVKLGQGEYLGTGVLTHPTLWTIRNHEKYKGLTATEIARSGDYIHAYLEDVSKPGVYHRNEQTPF